MSNQADSSPNEAPSGENLNRFLKSFDLLDVSYVLIVCEEMVKKRGN
jgi:hypothetical protein